jgi:hypothetical protein
MAGAMNEATERKLPLWSEISDLPQMFWALEIICFPFFER